MTSPYTADTPKLKLKIAGTLGLADRKPPITDAEFDSEIIGYYDSSSNCDLKITLKIYFKPMGPPAAPAHGQTNAVKAWGTDPQVVVRADKGYNDGNFAKFKEVVLQEVNTFWNGKMWLVTPDAYDGLDWLPIPAVSPLRPNVHCLFHAEEASGPNTAHLTIKCWRLVSGVDCTTFNSFSDEFDNYDVVSYAYSTGVDVGTGADKITAHTALSPQMTVWHEIGHAIGQKHSAASVAGCSGGNAPYGDCTAATPGQTKNIMGLGKEISAYNGSSWAKRMALHTNGTTTEADWITWTSRPAPKFLPTIP